MPSTESILAVIGFAATITTGLWHVAMHIGKLTNQMSRHSDQIKNLEYRDDGHDERIRDLIALQGNRHSDIKVQ